MRVSLHSLSSAWETLLSGGRRGGGGGGGDADGIVVFVAAPDVDALAAAASLSAQLRAEQRRHEVVPIGGYEPLKRRLRALRDNSAAGGVPRRVLCINCGAGVDIEQVFGLDNEPAAVQNGSGGDDDEARVLVLDRHRPFHLSNLDSRRVLLLDDEEEDDDDGDGGGDVDELGGGGEDSASRRRWRQRRRARPQYSALPIAGFEDEYGFVDAAPDDDDDDDDDGASDVGNEDDDDDGEVDLNSVGSHEHEDAESVGAAPSTNGRDQNHFEQSRIADHGGANRADDDRPPKRRRRRAAAERSARGGARRLTEVDEEMRERARRYYSRASLATPSSLLAYVCLRQLNRASADALWRAMLGVSDASVHGALDAGVYSRHAAMLRAQLPRFTAAAEDRAVTAADEAAVLDDDERVSACEELRIELLRHGALLESVRRSTFICSRLCTWRPSGQRVVQELLATLGISLRDAQQSWAHLPTHVRAALRARSAPLRHAQRRYGLESLAYDGFVRSRGGYRRELSAMDATLALAASLQLTAGGDAEIGGAEETEEEDAALCGRFWRAYDVLAAPLDDDARWGGALRAAQAAQLRLSELGAEVMQRKTFVASGPFRYAFVPAVVESWGGGANGAASAAAGGAVGAYDSAPLLLARLARFLADAVELQGAKRKPTVVLAPTRRSGGRGKGWLAVAVSAGAAYNDFGARFHAAAARHGTHVRPVGFDGGVIEVADGEELEFVRFLHDISRGAADGSAVR